MISAAEAARLYLAGAGQRPASHLPPCALMRELAEVRKLLGELLALLDQREEVSQP